MKFSNLLISTFLVITLTPAIYLSVLMQSNYASQLKIQTENHLLSIINIQESQLQHLIASYLEEIKVIAANKTLLSQLELQGQTQDAGADIDLKATLDAINEAATQVQRINVYGMDGNLLATTENQPGPSLPQADQESLHYKLAGMIRESDQVLLVRLLGPLTLDDRPLGTIEVFSNARPITEITTDYSGLGETGEVSLVKKTPAGDALFLNPLRFDADAAFNRVVPKENQNSPALTAINETGFDQKIAERFDYRGREVLTVTRYLDAVDWGILVKIDKAEALAPVRSLNKLISVILFVMAVFIIITAVIISRVITDPIRELSSAVEAVKRGDFKAKVEINLKNELGSFAKVFTSMIQKLDELYSTLEEKVKDRTARLARKTEQAESARKRILHLLDRIKLEKRQLAYAKAKDDAILASIADGLAVADKDGKLIYLNQEAVELLGGEANQSNAETWQKKYGVFDPDTMKPLQAQQMPLAMAVEGKYVEKVKLLIRNPKIPEGRFISVSASPIMLGNKKLGGVAIFRDITKENEVDKAKTEFVSLAAHQLRTPLTAISWYTEMLLSGDAGKLGKRQNDFLESIYTSNKHMVELVNTLLDVSRLELGTFKFEPEKVNIIELVKSVISEQKPRALSKQQKIIENYESKLGPMNADPKMLRIVIQNLLSNAIKYTPNKGQVTINVGEAKGKIQIKIADTGLGIPKDQKDKVFSKLFRADNAKEKVTEGNGLGLYIIKAIVENVGGTISFKSIENKGSTFLVMIPKNWKSKDHSDKIRT